MTKIKYYRVESELGDIALAEDPVRVADAALTPKAEATVANQLPRTEQLHRFEQDLEAHDSGNQPA